MIAVPIQLKQLTDSTVAVGLVGAAEFVPIIRGRSARRSHR